MRLKIADILKFGALYSQNGEWNSKQLIPPDWIETSTNHNTFAESQYGYHWWMLDNKKQDGDQDKTYYAMGMGGKRGQYIFVNRDQLLVTVFTSILSESVSSPVLHFNNIFLNS